MNEPWVYMCFPSWTPPPTSLPSHSSGSSQYTSPEHPDSCIKPGLVIYFTYDNIHQFSSVQLLSRVRLFATPWIAACQASLSNTNSQSSPRLMSIESVMPSSHLILCHPLLLLPPIPPSIRVFSNQSTLRMRWPFQCYSLKSSHLHLLLQSPKVCSLHLCLFCCLVYTAIVTIFLNFIYMC